MQTIYSRSKGLTDNENHYCPGCSHGIIHKLVAEALEELDLLGSTIGCAAVGCSILCYNYFSVDMIESAHGRAPAVATGVKRTHPDKTVFTYQGDGDLASIGTAEIVHAAHRSEKITTIFANNAIFGMTGGQMAPTTLANQKVTTAPDGRDPDHCGMPLKVSEMIAQIPGATYVERVSVHTPKAVKAAKKAILRGFQYQQDNRGFSLIEVLSSCPTGWNLSPVESMKWIETNMIPYYPLGQFRSPEEA